MTWMRSVSCVFGRVVRLVRRVCEPFGFGFDPDIEVAELCRFWHEEYSHDKRLCYNIVSPSSSPTIR